jgi:hypothetical protein
MAAGQLFHKVRQPDLKRPPAPYFGHVRTSTALHTAPPTLDVTTSPLILRAATSLKTSLALDPTLARDEVAIAAIITEEFRRGLTLASIPSSLRDDAC